jgi:hypothetical protein
MTTTTNFEDRLLVELRAVVAERPAATPAPAKRASSRLVLSGAATAAAAAAGASVFVLGAGSATPAFAVDRQADGDVSVTINRLSDAPELEAKLRAAGVPAVVDYTPAGKTCRQPRGTAPSGSSGKAAAVSGAKRTGSAIASTPSGATTFTITRGSVTPGETLVVMTSGGGDGPTSLGIAIVSGAVSPCELVDAPPLPAPGAGDSPAGAQQHHAG